MKKLKLDPTKTVLTITLGFLILHLIFGWQWALIVSLVAGLGGLFSRRIAEGINYLWIRLTLLLSFIVPNIIMGLIYYLFLTPIALLSKLFRKEDELLLKKEGNTTFFTIDRKIEKSSMEKMW